ncbi:hypothetical protein H0A36_00275 [Endozoicomonas sp. SM1973]|uniref:Uncharacterized protein n=1 Tax=Spartinivicinus marinus TaxID=2994442 RepID=A0A853I3A6_9GAMM|nr:hypothetical protein [Spartinivicinus marinus]MCX4026585.1 hypothetical protein [Spartinivicinus marinus]NYZ64421.1 hypothetical protein [Spartinivicinus marinus]
MKVTAAVIGMDYSHSRSIETLTVNEQRSRTLQFGTDKVSISVAAQQKYLYHLQQKFNSMSQIRPDLNDNQIVNKRLQLGRLDNLSAEPTKQFIKAISDSILNRFQVGVSSLSSTNNLAVANQSQQLTETSVVQISQYQLFQINEHSQFSTTGKIITADGRQIEFSVGFQIQQAQLFESSSQLTVVQQVVDPLVINFGAETINLTDTLFNFDLNGDGETEQISQLGSGSGYLALDHNNNGVIDNGLELFGPQTGQGFAELALYDNDNNLWIDENDPIFKDLKIWVQDGSEGGVLKSLAEVGVGAIYLGHTPDDFNLVSRQGALLGNIKGNGILLMENGDVKTIQEVDLAIQTSTDQSMADTQTLFTASNTIFYDKALKNLHGKIQALVNSDQQSNNTEQTSLLNFSQVNNIVEKLQRLRDEQKSYSNTIVKQTEESKSMVEQLLDKLQEQNEKLKKSNDS